ncbi:MAG: M23 family metallopeptidase [bacterium]|nr:M23 family metallopeptidase [bacterium]
MFSKYITFILIPERTGKVKRNRISLKMLVILGFFGIIGLMGWTWVVYDYLSIRSRLINLEENQAHFETQQTRIGEFNERFETTRQHFDHLNSLYVKLKRLTSLTAKSKDQTLEGEETERKDQLERARKMGILEVIASDISEIDTDKKVQEAQFKKLLEFFAGNANPLERMPRGWPVKGYVTNEFGVLHDSFSGQLRPQHGITIATRAFTPLYAPADAIVQFSGEDEYYGHLLELDHGNGIITRYGYVSNLQVETGSIVRRGDELAQILNTPRTTGPQLYYEVILNSVPQNPVKYINPLSLKD